VKRTVVPAVRTDLATVSTPRSTPSRWSASAPVSASARIRRS